MHESLLTGLALVLTGGVLQGSFMYPAKFMKNWAWENYWVIHSSVAYLLMPWALAALTVPHLGAVYSGASPGTLGLIALFGLAWGLGALTFGLGVDAVGLALGFAVILGVAATAGAIIPLAVHPPEQFSFAQGVVTGFAIVCMLAGVAVCSFAGKWKEQGNAGGRSYSRGIVICVISGLLSSCGNLGFVFGAEVAARAGELGAAEHLAGNAVWSLLAVPMFVCNAGYAAVLLVRNGSAARYGKPGRGKHLLLGISMGLLWMGGLSLYGMGARRMGVLGVSLGWAILMSAIVLMAGVLGLASGEWRGAPASASRRLAVGTASLLAAIAALGYANALQAGA